jgi:DNA-binding XRE family transcriptional regulator
MDKRYTKAEARKLFGADNDNQLAKVFEVSRQSLYAIDDDAVLSDARQWQIRAILAESGKSA